MASLILQHSFLQEGAPSAPSNEELDGLREQLEEAKKQAALGSQDSHSSGEQVINHKKL